MGSIGISHKESGQGGLEGSPHHWECTLLPQYRIGVWCAFIVGRPSGGEPGWDGGSTWEGGFHIFLLHGLHTEARTSCWLPPGVVVQLLSHALLLFVTP